MTAAALRSHSVKQLAGMARNHGISGWHAMRKEELIQALLTQSNGTKVADNSPARRILAKQMVDAEAEHRPVKNDNPAAVRNLQELQRKTAALKNLARDESPSAEMLKTDSLVIMVRDPYWLHACWRLSQRSIDRAQAAMGRRWHNCQPTLRLYRILEAGSSELERDIAVHGGVSNWYVDVARPPSGFRMEIGYLAADGWFYALARSNTVHTPSPSATNNVDDTWSDIARNADVIFAMSGGYSPQGTSRELQEMLEERLRRPLGSPMKTRFGNGAAFEADHQLDLAIDAEVTIYGATARDAHVTLKGAPVSVQPDGTFSARLKLSEMRQVIPIVACSSDGLEQRTVILAVERNTKVMEPVIRDSAYRKQGS